MQANKEPEPEPEPHRPPEPEPKRPTLPPVTSAPEPESSLPAEGPVAAPAAPAAATPIAADADAADAAAADPAAAEPDELLCPINKAIFRDPVFVCGSGNTYERASIEGYWAMHPPGAHLSVPFLVFSLPLTAQIA